MAPTILTSLALAGNLLKMIHSLLRPLIPRIQSIEGTGREIPVSTMDTNQTVENLGLSQHSWSI